MVNRLHPATVLPLIIVCLCTLLAAQVDDKGAVKAFKKGSKSKQSEIRLAALSSLEDRDTEVIAKLLVKTYLQAGARTDEVDVRRKEVADERRKLTRGHEFDKSPSYPKPIFDRLKSLKKEATELRTEVDTLRAIEIKITELVSKLESPKALAYLIKNVVGKKQFDANIKLAVARATGTQGEVMVESLVKALPRAKKPEAIIALLDALGRIGPAAWEATPAMIKLLAFADGAVRERAAMALARVPDTAAIEPMIHLLARETGQAKKSIARSLEIMTQQQFGINVATWRTWYKAEGKQISDSKSLGGGKPSPSKADKNRGYYFDIPQDGKSMLYIIDASGSMEAPISGRGGSGHGGASLDGKDAKGGSKSRLEACKAELITALSRLTPKAHINLIWYNNLPHMWQPKMQKATPGVIKEAQDWIRQLKPASSTNIHDSLQMAFSLTGRGVKDKYYALELDTIFLLTDGTPTKDSGEPDSTERIIAAVRTWNPLKRVTIHTIAIGKDLNTAFLSQLASENGGMMKQR